MGDAADSVSGRAYIDALVAAGFDKARDAGHPGQSTVGNPAESIQFSVRWGEECLVGQVGPATGEPVAIVLPVLAEGTASSARRAPSTGDAGRARAEGRATAGRLRR